MISNVDQHVTTISEAVGGQEKTTQSMVNQIMQTGDEVGKMAQNVRRTTTASEGIASDVAAVSSSAHEVADAMGRVNKQAVELAEMGEELRAIIGRYRLS